MKEGKNDSIGRNEMENKREGRHDGPREKRSERKKYTLEEITVESTGITKDNPIFDSAYQQVKRIMARIKDFINRPNLVIDEEFKPIIVRIVRKFYCSEHGAENLTAMLRKQLELERHDDHGDEDDIWSKLSFIEMIANMPGEKEPALINETPEFREIADKINKIIYMDIFCLTMYVADQEKKMELLQEYLDDLLDEDGSGFFASWRAEIEQVNRNRINQMIAGCRRKNVVPDSCD